MTIKEIAERYGVAEPTAYRYVNSSFKWKHHYAYKEGGKQYYRKEGLSELDKIVEQFNLRSITHGFKGQSKNEWRVRR